MKGNYRLSPNAEDDLERIWFYGLERWGVQRADRYIQDIHKQFQKLADQPFLYGSVDDIRPNYRRCVFQKDSIFYRVNGDVVEIMAIIGRQDLETWL